MSQSLVFLLLMLALVLPLFGAIVLRLLAPRLAVAPLYGAAALIFAVAVISVLTLARGNISSLQVGGLSLLLPVSGPDDQDLALPPLTDLPPLGSTPTAAGSPTAASSTPALTATTGLSVTQAPTQAAPTAVATALPPTAEPTAVPPTAAPTAIPPTEAPTAEPTAVPPTAAPSGPRTYTVQPGDTLRSIAEQFNVSVQAIIDANDLTPAQADSLRVGQELVIPSAAQA